MQELLDHKINMTYICTYGLTKKKARYHRFRKHTHYLRKSEHSIEIKSYFISTIFSHVLK